MQRDAIDYLLAWKQTKNRKPLIIRGARQVGKTWLMKFFGNAYYHQVAYLNFESNPALKELFSQDFDTHRLLLGIEIASGVQIDPSTTLLIFDEIQAVPKAITSLKYFQENLPDYHIICAGSLLGVALHENTSFPVGKVAFLDLYPLSFPEFLNALGDSRLAEVLQKKDWPLVQSFKDSYTNLLRLYYFTGGMPEAVACYATTKNLNEVRKIQQAILTAYEQDFSKHAPPSIVPRIRMIWNAIPAQLAKENKKFIYGLIRKGARAKDFEVALAWLKDCGLIYQIHQVSKPHIPLKAYETFNVFKIYMVDVGLLGAMVNLNQKVVLEKNTIFTEFKGALSEQYVLQQLKTFANLPIYYWSADNARAEVDFTIQVAGEIIPIEVKAEENLQAKSLRVYAEKFNPKTILRVSMANYREEDWMQNIPLYALPFYISDTIGQNM
jgi:predicted AAA+ superfamily ATPase